MPIAAPAAGDRILNTDLGAFYNLLKGVAASGEAITLIYNAAGVIAFIPSSDPAASTQLFQIKNAASTVKSALTAGGGALFSSQVNFAKGSDIASAGTTDLSTITGNYAQVSGTTTITAFGTVQAGTIMALEFQGILTLTHNASSLILRSGTNATTAAGDIYIFVSEGSGNWREIAHLTASAATSEPNRLATARFTDDFFFGQPTSLAFGLNWFVGGTAGSFTFLNAVANHPGIAQASSSVTNPGSAILYSGNSANQFGVLPADNFDFTWIVRPSSTVDTNMIVRFGLMDTGVTLNVNGTAPANGIYVEKASADSSWFGVTRSAASQTRTAALGTVTNGTWARLRVRRSDASTIAFSLDGGTESTLTATIPSAAMECVFFICNNSSANARTCDMDLFDLSVIGLTR